MSTEDETLTQVRRLLFPAGDEQGNVFAPIVRAISDNRGRCSHDFLRVLANLGGNYLSGHPQETSQEQTGAATMLLSLDSRRMMVKDYRTLPPLIDVLQRCHLDSGASADWSDADDREVVQAVQVLSAYVRECARRDISRPRYDGGDLDACQFVYVDVVFEAAEEQLDRGSPLRFMRLYRRLCTLLDTIDGH